MGNQLQQLSKSEMEVMEVIWDVGEKITPKELLAILEDQGKTWKRQTLNTFLFRLEEKGMVSRRYMSVKAACTKEEYMHRQSRGIIDNLYDGKLGYFVSSLAGNVGITRQDAEELKKLIEEYSADNAGGEK